MAVNAAPATDLADYYRRRADSYERVYYKPERVADEGLLSRIRSAFK